MPRHSTLTWSIATNSPTASKPLSITSNKAQVGTLALIVNRLHPSPGSLISARPPYCSLASTPTTQKSPLNPKSTFSFTPMFTATRCLLGRPPTPPQLEDGSTKWWTRSLNPSTFNPRWRLPWFEQSSFREWFVLHPSEIRTNPSFFPLPRHWPWPEFHAAQARLPTLRFN